MFEKLTLEQYNEILASKAPTPGGGSALAVVGTIACSLVEMSVNVTLTKLKETDENRDYLLTNLKFLQRAKERLFQLADQDAEAFRHIIDCMHLPKETDSQRQQRTSTLQKAYHKAALVPLDVMRICKESLAYSEQRIYPLLYKYVASDCKIGIDLFRNIIENSLENVYANTTLITDPTLRAMLENQGKEILAQSQKLC